MNKRKSSQNNNFLYDTFIEITKKKLLEFKASLDGRGVVSIIKFKQFPITYDDMDQVHEWIKQRLDFGELRSTYALQEIIQESTNEDEAVSNGSIIAVSIGLGNIFEIDRLSLEVSFPNRLLENPKVLRTPSIDNLQFEKLLQFRKLTSDEKITMVAIVDNEWKEKNFGFSNNVKEILASKFLYGIFKQNDDFIGFVVFYGQDNLSPMYLEIFPTYQKQGFGNSVVDIIQREMKYHLMTINVIPEAKTFWEKHGFKKFDKMFYCKIC